MHRTARSLVTALVPALVTALATVVLGLGPSLGLTACSANNDEEEVRSAITTTLDAFKNPSEESLSPYLGTTDNETIAQLSASGVDLYDILAHLLSKFDYAVGEIAVDGDSATAEVTVTNVDLRKASETLQGEIADDPQFLANLIAKGAQKDAEGIYALILEKLYDAIDDTADTASANATLKLEKRDGAWTVDDDSISELVSKSFDGLDMDDLTQGSWT